MKLLREFAPSILSARRLFLLLDFDGTLADIAPHPSGVRLSPRRRKCLAELVQAPDIMMAVVSGRRADDVQRILRLKGIFYVGLHGLVTVTPRGERIGPRVGRGYLAALEALREEFAGPSSRVPGVFVEDKGLTLAVHFRQAKKGAAQEAVKHFVRVAGAYREQGVPLQILQGKKVVEVKPAGFDKGDAVTLLLNRYGRGAFPVFIGDDLTDEAAFESLRRRGLTVLVARVSRPTAARCYLRSPQEVYGFLKRLMELRRKALAFGSARDRVR